MWNSKESWEWWTQQECWAFVVWAMDWSLMYGLYIDMERTWLKCWSLVSGRYPTPTKYKYNSQLGGWEWVKTLKIFALFAGSSCNLAIIKFLLAGLEQVPLCNVSNRQVQHNTKQLPMTISFHTQICGVVPQKLYRSNVNSKPCILMIFYHMLSVSEDLGLSFPGQKPTPWDNHINTTWPWSFIKGLLLCFGWYPRYTIIWRGNIEILWYDLVGGVTNYTFSLCLLASCLLNWNGINELVEN